MLGFICRPDLSGQCNRGGQHEDIVGGEVVDAFLRPCVELVLKFHEYFQCQRREVPVLREALSDQGVVVLVEATLPEAVWMGEIG